MARCVSGEGEDGTLGDDAITVKHSRGEEELQQSRAQQRAPTPAPTALAAKRKRPRHSVHHGRRPADVRQRGKASHRMRLATLAQGADQPGAHRRGAFPLSHSHLRTFPLSRSYLRTFPVAAKVTRAAGGPPTDATVRPARMLLAMMHPFSCRLMTICGAAGQE